MIILELISDNKYSKEDHPAAINTFITNNFRPLTNISGVLHNICIKDLRLFETGSVNYLIGWNISVFYFIYLGVQQARKEIVRISRVAMKCEVDIVWKQLHASRNLHYCYAS